MKKRRITYGVSGMMEYQTVIKIGKSNMKVLFSDGSVSAMGVNPATFTTDNFVVQHAIENSADYKRGRIKSINAIELDEELQIESNAERAEKAVQKQPQTKAKASGQGQINEQAETMPESQEPKPENTRLEFTCNDDAKDYLEQTFGHVRSKLRNREDIVTAGKAHNVDIIFV